MHLGVRDRGRQERDVERDRKTNWARRQVTLWVWLVISYLNIHLPSPLPHLWCGWKETGTFHWLADLGLFSQTTFSKSLDIFGHLLPTKAILVTFFLARIVQIFTWTEFLASKKQQHEKKSTTWEAESAPSWTWTIPAFLPLQCPS